MRSILGLILFVMAAALPVFGLPPATPEIDGSTAAGAIALLVGGVLVIQYRRKK